MAKVVYHRPPDGYVSPSVSGCATCGAMIVFGPVIGGHKWSHLSRYVEHEVVMPHPWWDTSTGTFKTGPWGEPWDSETGPEG